MRIVSMSYTCPQALPSSLARRPVLVGHGDKVGGTQAREFTFSTGELKQIRRWVSIWWVSNSR